MYASILLRRPGAGHIFQLRGVAAGDAPATRLFEQGDALSGFRAEDGLPIADDAEVQAVSHFGETGILVNFNCQDVK